MIKQDKRFTNYKDGSGKSSKMLSTYIIVDEQTGVQYLYAAMGYGAGVTPIIDKDGKPVLADGYPK
ncbi:DUF6440 family protein [Macrococcoides caseolyticum]|uniref:DUF6440 family protein n=1 Tax=Macrococcoides caseolyticum TaxID=69966 RepID=UPI001F3C65FA|nr:DUF6440 family protein [Macrococcus caseolyticus]MCE4956420.1 xylan 1,4-beta-xylosidase [Macrococcus caseolyticus]